MKMDPAVKKMTLQIGTGMLIGTVIMLIVYALLGKLDSTVICGGLLGAFVGTSNFLLMGIAVQRAAAAVPDGPDAPDSAYEDVDPEAEIGEGVENSSGTNLTPMTDEGRRMKKQMQASYSLRMGLLVVLSLCAALLPVFDTLAYVIPLVFPRIILMVLSFRNP